MSESPNKPQPKPPAPLVPDTPLPEPEPSIVIPTLREAPVYTKRINENSIYADVINHCRRPDLGYTRDTNAHESTHGIQADLRNQFNIRSSIRYNAFYVLNGKYVLLEEPGIRKRDIASYIPKSLRENRYNTYIVGQSVWDDTPLYIMDEWSAYINGGAVSVEDAKNGKNKSRYDGVKGALEFSIYSVALCMAVKDKDPDYWNNSELKNFTYMQLKRSYDVFNEGITMPQFQGYRQDQYLNNLKNSQDAKPIRDFLKKEFMGVWIN